MVKAFLAYNATIGPVSSNILLVIHDEDVRRQIRNFPTLIVGILRSLDAEESRLLDLNKVAHGIAFELYWREALHCAGLGDQECLVYMREVWTIAKHRPEFVQDAKITLDDQDPLAGILGQEGYAHGSHARFMAILDLLDSFKDVWWSNVDVLPLTSDFIAEYMMARSLELVEHFGNQLLMKKSKIRRKRGEN